MELISSEYAMFLFYAQLLCCLTFDICGCGQCVNTGCTDHAEITGSLEYKEDTSYENSSQGPS